jgi:hypothetical protein
MYLIVVIVLTVVAPLVSTLIHAGAQGWDVDLLALAGMWWVFWGVGIRLLSAGLSQAMRPGFTLKNILGHDDPGAGHIVQELGFANIGMGVAGILSLFFPSWMPAAATAGGLFLLIAGLRHIVKPGKNIKETIATITDLIVAVIVLAAAIEWIFVH